MAQPASDRVFAQSVPQMYERYMVPLIFQPYAGDLAQRAAERAPARVLEVAAGTGVLTRELARTLPASSTIVATDLNQPMLDEAAARGTSRPVTWRTADALQLPFEDASFDAVLCQFGAMFFPDKGKAFAEARRVLRPGGVLLFNVWDAIEHNEFTDVVTDALAGVFPHDPPRFMARTPHGYHDPDLIREHLAQGGFTRGVQLEVVTRRSRAESPRHVAIAICQGSPLRSEIEARGGATLAEATQAAATAIAQRFGSGAVDGKIQALVVSAER
jgi:ubiquinone/menaquinone biosynthesis C-methylase UbiE